MIAFAFAFPAGRYHATPWGRHVNEADIAWPPEPVRILRALIATWWRKGDHASFSKPLLDQLIDTLASELPVYRLPEAVHAHVRAFMPAPVDKRLIFDAFVRVQKNAELIAAWPGITLQADEAKLATHLLERIGYLGRAESWVEARVTEAWDGEFNAAPRTSGGVSASTAPVDLAAPLAPTEWKAEYERLMGEARDAKGGKGNTLRATLPEKLCDAIACDTSDWHEAGWSSPPPLRKVVYDRPQIGPLPPMRRRKSASADAGVPGRPQVARYVLAGRPAPRIEDALRIGEVLRLALMSRCPGDKPPQELSGRGENGPLRDDPRHAHAFFLPEDADGDGVIDHLIVYSSVGFSEPARIGLDKLTKLWVERGGRRNTDKNNTDNGRKEWRLAFEEIAEPGKFCQSRLLGTSKIWRSVTPYLKPRFDKQPARTPQDLVESYRKQIELEWSRRFPGIHPPSISAIHHDEQRPDRFIVAGKDGRLRSPLAFARTRGARGGHQADTSGGFFMLEFSGMVEGPIALGWGAHYGLGLFERE